MLVSLLCCSWPVLLLINPAVRRARPSVKTRTSRKFALTMFCLNLRCGGGLSSCCDTSLAGVVQVRGKPFPEDLGSDLANEAGSHQTAEERALNDEDEEDDEDDDNILLAVQVRDRFVEQVRRLPEDGLDHPLMHACLMGCVVKCAVLTGISAEALLFSGMKGAQSSPALLSACCNPTHVSCHYRNFGGTPQGRAWNSACPPQPPPAPPHPSPAPPTAQPKTQNTPLLLRIAAANVLPKTALIRGL